MKHVYILRHVASRNDTDWTEVYSSLKLARIALRRLIKEYADEGIKMVRFTSKHHADFYSDEIETDLFVTREPIISK